MNSEFEQMTISGIPVYNVPDAQAAIAAIERKIDIARSLIHLAFVNAHVVNVGVNDHRYGSVLRRTDLNLADGVGIWLAGKYLYGKGVANLNGTDFGITLLRWAAMKRYRVFLLGSKPGVAELAKQKFERSIAGLNVVGYHHGYFSDEESYEIIDRINETQADILIVCLGVPRQDMWIHRHRDHLKVRIAAGMGGFLDFHSGMARRAPILVRRARLEWLHRLIMEPSRLWRRYLIGNPSFILRVARNKKHT